MALTAPLALNVALNDVDGAIVVAGGVVGTLGAMVGFRTSLGDSVADSFTDVAMMDGKI